jgi:hypothetical protein
LREISALLESYEESLVWEQLSMLCTQSCSSGTRTLTFLLLLLLLLLVLLLLLSSFSLQRC